LPQFHKVICELVAKVAKVNEILQLLWGKNAICEKVATHIKMYKKVKKTWLSFRAERENS